MSGFAVHLARQPLAPTVPGVLRDAIAHRGPHRLSVETIGPCTMVNAALWTTPESPAERQPQRHASRGFWLTADARIDNRQQLRAALRGRVRHPLDTDSDLILASYERWGRDCPNQLAGDFAFAIWDGEREEVFLARDPFGIRPAYYANTDTGFVAASTIGAVLSIFDSTPAIDAEYLSGFLTDVTPRDRTVWNGIRRLAPGEAMSVSATGTRVDTYWQPDLTMHDLAPDETAETVRTLFDAAVHCRMRTLDGVSSQLSGGFDSTTVTATAARFDPAVRAVSLIYPGFPDADESAHIAAAAEHSGVECELIDGTAVDAVDPKCWAREHSEPLYSADVADTAACLSATAARGTRVLLVGGGGDELLFGSQTATFDLATELRVREAFRWARLDGMSTRAATLGFTRALLGSLISTNRTASALRTRQRERHEARSRPWMRVQFPVPPRPRRSLARGHSERLVLYTDRSWAQYSAETANILAANVGVEIRYPFFDRRLVEFILRTPEKHIRINGQYRGLHRVAFSDRLPESLLTRTDKADFSGPYLSKIFSMFDETDAVSAFTALESYLDLDPYLRGFRRGMDAFAPSNDPAGFELWAALTAGTFLYTRAQ